MDIPTAELFEMAKANPSMVHQVVAPAGSTLVFGETTQHATGPHTSGRERAIAHAVLATGGAFDKLGADASPSLIDAVDALSDDPATRRRQREVVAQQQADSWELQRANSAA